MPPILEWPIKERPREKMLLKGAEHLSDAELLAILFGSGTKGRSAVDLGRDLLKQFNGLRGIFSASCADFTRSPGLGLTKYCQCQASLELSRRALRESLGRESVMTQVNQVKTFLMSKMRDYPHEVFACLFLDNRHRIICFEKLFYGSINRTSVHPRVLIQRCLYHNAAALILVHNHPSGLTEPSQADCDMTHTLYAALALIDIRLLDHMIVGDTSVNSLAEQGLLVPQ